jgi:hypothetical protein
MNHPHEKIPHYPYSGIFFLKNHDPSNYVLHKDFIFYSILSLYLFLTWYYVNIFRNYDFMIKTNEGGISWYFSVISLTALATVFFLSFTQRINNIYPLLGLGYSLLLLSMAILIFNYEKNEIDRGFENDPVQLAYIFMILYSFISFFIC